MNSLCMMNKELLNMINQLFEIQKKVEKEGYSKIDRNLSRLTEEFENLGFSRHQCVCPILKLARQCEDKL